MMGWFDQEQAVKQYGYEKMEEGRREGRAKEIVETGYEFAMPKEDIIKRLQIKLDISIQKATEYFNRYHRQTM